MRGRWIGRWPSHGLKTITTLGEGLLAVATSPPRKFRRGPNPHRVGSLHDRRIDRECRGKPPESADVPFVGRIGKGKDQRSEAADVVDVPARHARRCGHRIPCATFQLHARRSPCGIVLPRIPEHHHLGSRVGIHRPRRAGRKRIGKDPHRIAFGKVDIQLVLGGVVAGGESVIANGRGRTVGKGVAKPSIGCRGEGDSRSCIPGQSCRATFQPDCVRGRGKETHDFSSSGRRCCGQDKCSRNGHEGAYGHGTLVWTSSASNLDARVAQSIGISRFRATFAIHAWTRLAGARPCLSLFALMHPQTLLARQLSRLALQVIPLQLVSAGHSLHDQSRSTPVPRSTEHGHDKPRDHRSWYRNPLR